MCSVKKTYMVVFSHSKFVPVAKSLPVTENIIYGVTVLQKNMRGSILYIGSCETSSQS